MNKRNSLLMKRFIILLILILSVSCKKQVAGKTDMLLSTNDKQIAIVPFEATVYNVESVFRANSLSSYSYDLSDYLANKKNGLIVAGIDANWRMSTVIIDTLSNSKLISVGDSIDFIIHSPAKILVDSDSLPQNYKFELHADLTDSMAIEFTIWPYSEGN